MNQPIKKNVSEFQKGKYIVLKDRPCKLVEIHSHPEKGYSMTGIDIFKYIKICQVFPKNSLCVEPQVVKTTYQIKDIEDQKMLVLSDLNNNKSIVKHELPQNKLGEQILNTYTSEKTFRVIIISVCSQEQITSFYQKIN
ncbi:eukaryotic translation initiation factor 5a [Anaeramoeba flamelloides]|uniref:Eukaryotic translation initiation factor 5a n=1 Tax=Anaeramoeba flamelloides TaxID=1746091 RepID=A0ABQ8YJ73_9EUKA|nr:eukaryotic translation initiation factor 5a [Anaeramoeba flamelloides]